MSDISLSVALSRNTMTEPILSGRVKAQGIRWATSAVHPSEMFWRQLKFQDFDISEMSLSSMTIAASQGTRDWVALPVFTSRRFFHTGIVVRDGAGIESPADLVGKRVGVPEYQQTAAVWTRAALQHEFGVVPEQMTWLMERPPSKSHGGSTAFSPPPGVKLSYISTDTNIGEMLGRAELDAAAVYIADNNLIDRTRASAADISGVRTLFADPVAEGARYYQSTGLLPVNHVVVIRKNLLEQEPWIALNVYAAFLEAKQVARAPVKELLEPWLQIGTVPQVVSAALDTVDPLPYGLRDQPEVFQALSTYLQEQGLTSEKFPIEDLFAKATLDM
jgi:ABC-type taurine transport system, periplasmic component